MEGDRRFPWKGAPIVWYRPSIRKLAWHLWGWACLWVVAGAFVLGALRVGRVDFGSAWLVVYAIGILMVMAGPWTLLVGLQRAAKIEQVLSVHDEGVRWQDGAVVAHFEWSELEAIEIEDDHLALRGSTTRVVLPPEMDGIAPATLAAILGDMRKKALLGLPVRLTIDSDRA